MSDPHDERDGGPAAGEAGLAPDVASYPSEQPQAQAPAIAETEPTGPRGVPFNDPRQRDGSEDKPGVPAHLQVACRRERLAQPTREAPRPIRHRKIQYHLTHHDPENCGGDVDRIGVGLDDSYPDRIGYTQRRVCFTYKCRRCGRTVHCRRTLTGPEWTSTLPFIDLRGRDLRPLNQQRESGGTPIRPSY